MRTWPNRLLEEMGGKGATRAAGAWSCATHTLRVWDTRAADPWRSSSQLRTCSVALELQHPGRQCGRTAVGDVLRFGASLVSACAQQQRCWHADGARQGARVRVRPSASGCTGTGAARAVNRLRGTLPTRSGRSVVAACFNACRWVDCRARRREVVVVPVGACGKVAQSQRSEASSPRSTVLRLCGRHAVRKAVQPARFGWTQGRGSDDPDVLS